MAIAKICGGTSSLISQSPSWLVAQRPDIGAAVATNLTGELGLEVGQEHMIRPARGVNHDRVRALLVSAVDKQPARAVV